MLRELASSLPGDYLYITWSHHPTTKISRLISYRLRCPSILDDDRAWSSSTRERANPSDQGCPARSWSDRETPKIEMLKPTTDPAKLDHDVILPITSPGELSFPFIGDSHHRHPQKINCSDCVSADSQILFPYYFSSYSISSGCLFLLGGTGYSVWELLFLWRFSTELVYLGIVIWARNKCKATRYCPTQFPPCSHQARQSWYANSFRELGLFSINCHLGPLAQPFYSIIVSPFYE